MPDGSGMSGRPLDGLLVADLSRVLAGPAATVTLADLGATVVKVERVESGDDTRSWGPPWTASSSAYFEAANRSKRSLAVDLTDPDDVAMVRTLATRADIVVENFRPGALVRYGLDYASVSAANPRTIYCSITGFGPRAADLSGYDFLVQALGGLMSITGDPDGPPTKVGVALVDVLTSKDAVVGVLAAVAHRERTGEGQHVEVNLLSSLLASLANQASSYLTTGQAPGRLGNRHPSIAPYELLQCADGPVAVCCGSNGQFRRLAETIGDADLPADPRFTTNERRVRHRDALVERLERALASAPAEVWARRLRAVAVPAGVVGDIRSAFALAASLELEPLVHVGPEHPPQVRHPVTYSGFEVAPPTAPPRLGEHGDEIRRMLKGTADKDPADAA